MGEKVHYSGHARPHPRLKARARRASGRREQTFRSLTLRRRQAHGLKAPGGWKKHRARAQGASMRAKREPVRRGSPSCHDASSSADQNIAKGLPSRRSGKASSASPKARMVASRAPFRLRPRGAATTHAPGVTSGPTFAPVGAENAPPTGDVFVCRRRARPAGIPRSQAVSWSPRQFSASTGLAALRALRSFMQSKCERS